MSRLLRALHRAFWGGLVATALVVTAVVVYAEAVIPEFALRVVFTSPVADRTVVFHSSNGEWTAHRSTAIPVIAGVNEVDLPLPSRLGEAVRWDPAPAAGRYTIESVALIRNGEAHPLGPEALRSPAHRSEQQELLPAGSELALTATDSDPQLIVSLAAGDTSSVVRWGVVVPLAAVVAALLAAAVVAWRRTILTEERVAIGFVFWLFGLFVFHVAELAPRLPYWDDWRYLLDLRSDGSLPLSPRWLLTPFNDTVYATGKLLDSVILNATDFSFVTLHVFGAALVGVWLAMMVVLVRRVGGRVAPRAVPYAILLLAFALVAQSYWLQPGIAYHQFLPLLFGTAILLVLGGQSRPVGRAVLVGILGGLAGLAYISGAVLLGLMAVCYALTHGRELWRQRLVQPALPGLALAAAAVASIGLQVGLVAVVQGSLLDNSSVAATTYPWQPEFWAFFLGTSGRTVGLTGGEVLIAASVAAVFIATPLVVAAAYWGPARPGRRLGRYDAFVLGTAAVVVPVYFALVTAGRAAMLDPSEPLGAVFRFGAARFHFWWGAALIPLVWLGWLAAARAMPRRHAGVALTLVAVVTLVIAVPKSLAGWHYPDAFAPRTLAFQRNDACITSHLRNGNTDFVCPFSSSGNIGPRVLLGYRHDLAFVDDAGLPPAIRAAADG